MNQLYWQVYLNLEREFLALADTIFINDAQQEVYSMRIADILIRTVIEIEALAKELYLSNGGEITSDEKMYFDTVCMAHLKLILTSIPLKMEHNANISNSAKRGFHIDSI